MSAFGGQNHFFYTTLNCIVTRRLATANRSCVSMCGRPCKIFPHVQFHQRAKFGGSYTMYAHVEDPKNLGTMGPAPWEGNVAHV